jgi:hypothetical protein
MSNIVEISNLILGSQIITATGNALYVNGASPSIDNQSGFITSSQTGQFYPTSNLQQYIKSGDVSSTYATISNLAFTGTTLNNQINSLSGYVNSLPAGNSSIINNAVTGLGTLGYIPVFIASNSGISNSIIFNTGRTIGINNQNPVEDLDISGTVLIHNNDSINILYSTGISSTYQQINIKNISGSTNSSSDLVATADIGNENNFYVNLGINSSTYTGQSVGLSGDSYLFSQANDLYIGNTNPNKRILFFINSNSTGINTSLMSMSQSQVNISGNLFTSGGQVLTIADSGNLQNQLNSKALYVPLSVGTITWTSMPGAVTFFNGVSSSISFVDLTLYTGVNLIVNKGATAGAATGAIYLGYRGDANFAAANYLPIETTSAKLFVNVTGQLLTSGFKPLVAGAKSGVYIALIGSGGTALSPVFGNITALFK